MKRKLQVFVSSTYIDMKDERQAAVEAILKAGHIPAGMELFAAGDDSQLAIIRKWIDRSDAFMLILGGRYGTIEEKSGKSYIELEYDYAEERGKRLFAVLIDDAGFDAKIRLAGASAVERSRSDLLDAFRARVKTKLSGFYTKPDDIKLRVFESLSTFSDDPDLPGWVHGSEVIEPKGLIEENDRLRSENARLARRNAELESLAGDSFNGATFEQTVQDLLATRLDYYDVFEKDAQIASNLVHVSRWDVPALHLFWYYQSRLTYGFFLGQNTDFQYRKLIEVLSGYGLVEIRPWRHNPAHDEAHFLPAGQRFVRRLRATPDVIPPDQPPLPTPAVN